MPAAGPGTRRIAADFIRAADFTDRRSISLVPQERISLRSSAQPDKFLFVHFLHNPKKKQENYSRLCFFRRLGYEI